jgi:hypothetical protein
MTENGVAGDRTSYKEGLGESRIGVGLIHSF